jgi:DNA-binding CsgD family transcriptional regulator
MDIRLTPTGAIEPAVINAYERALGALDGPGFETAVSSALAEIVPSVRLYMFEGAGRRGPTQLRMARCEPNIQPYLGAYERQYEPTDPVRNGVDFLRRSETVLMRVVPDDIRQVGFRNRFFDACEIVERNSVLQRTPSGGWRCMSISRNSATGPCSEQELSHLVALAQLLLPMMSRHWAQNPAAMPPKMSVTEIEQRFAERFPELSRREREVCARAAVGVSVEGTALDLGIAGTSVLTYRKRAYARLSVSGPYELACLVMH